MDFKLNREEISTSEVIFDGLQEQSAELDYVLPDYYPEIFKIVKCIATPKIVSYSVNGDKLTYELSICMRIMYCSEQSNTLHVLDQKLNYTKTAELGKTAVKPQVLIYPKTDYINCRAVNQRRIDVRGAISIKIKVTDINRKEVISDAYGMNIQLRKVPVTYPSSRLYTTKRITVEDDFDLGLSKPSVLSIIRNDAIVASTDKKVIANKLVAKGEIYINMLYTCMKDGADAIEAMQFTMPFSQIIDLEGIDDRYDCVINADVISCELVPKSDGDGDSKIIHCTVMLLITVSANRLSTVDIATDQYSTAYKSESQTSDIKVELSPCHINSSQVIKGSVEYKEGELDIIYDVWCTVNGFTVKPDSNDNSIVISGKAVYTVVARNQSGSPVVLEKEDIFDFKVPTECISEGSIYNINIVPVSCSYTLTSDNTVEIKSELKVTGMVYNTMYMKALTDISVNEAEPLEKDGDYALRLYFADKGEDMWEIAKKYGTSINAIMEENNLNDEVISEHGMILIPIV